MTKRIALAGIILALLIASSVVGYRWYSAKEAPPKDIGPLERITIGTIRSELSTLIWVAESKGYFKEHGLDVTINEYQSGHLTLDDLLGKNIDIATSTEFAFVSKIFERGDSLKCMGSSVTADDHAIVFRKDRGIAGPGDLRGKRIGATFKTTGPFFLGVFLTLNGLSLDDVEVIDVKPFDMKEALAAGRVDALITWEPNVWKIMTEMGQEVMAWPGQSGQEIYWLLVSTSEVLEARGRAMEQLLAALVRAEDFVREKGEEAREIVGRRLGFDVAYIEHVWPKTKCTLSLDQALLLAMEDEARWMIENNMAYNNQKIPNYLHYLNVNPLYQARPQSVELMAIKNSRGGQQ